MTFDQRFINVNIQIILNITQLVQYPEYYYQVLCGVIDIRISKQ